MGRVYDKTMGKLMRISPMKLILGGYCLVILVGTFLLWLPIATRTGTQVAFSDSLFTATSAACVTGLIRFDTFTCWSLFGQIVILCLIQIGGVGFMTIVMGALSAIKKKIGLQSRVLMQNAISAPELGGMVKITKFILKGTLLVEGCGALLLAVYFVPRLGFLYGLWYSVFHAISAFCNAGFDLFGRFLVGSSLITVGGDWYVNIVLMVIIVIGGLGFFVWKDLLDHKFSFTKLRLQSKLVIVTSAVLVVGGAVLLFLLELKNPAFQQMPAGKKVLTSVFQSVTARTAGFNSVDLAALTQGSQVVMIILMLIGGSSGSTAGGLKTTTIAVQILSIRSVFRQKKSVEAFHRTIEDSVIRTSACIISLYLILAIGAGLVISAVESLPFITALFETSSAVATVGLTLGITAKLGMLSKIILTALMIFGRAGSLTILLAFTNAKHTVDAKYPAEQVTVG